MPHMPVE